jgi:hypothetical protein
MEPVLVAQALNALFGIASLAILALGLAVFSACSASSTSPTASW